MFPKRILYFNLLYVFSTIFFSFIERLYANVRIYIWQAGEGISFFYLIFFLIAFTVVLFFKGLTIFNTRKIIFSITFLLCFVISFVLIFSRTSFIQDIAKKIIVLFF